VARRRSGGIDADVCWPLKEFNMLVLIRYGGNCWYVGLMAMFGIWLVLPQYCAVTRSPHAAFRILLNSKFV
jgi:hypothetical protein